MVLDIEKSNLTTDKSKLLMFGLQEVGTMCLPLCGLGGWAMFVDGSSARSATGRAKCRLLEHVTTREYWK